MGKYLLQITGAFILFFLFSCREEYKYSYAISDFRPSLQPHLIEIVSKGILMHYYPALKEMATDKELVRLSKSEHPLLRAAAFSEMLNRESFADFDILMQHLDDTAFIARDEGEFGIAYSAVSDHILINAEWKSSADMNKTIDKVITKHNYLKSAYTILSQIPIQEKYYPFIKEMAFRKRTYLRDDERLIFDEIEHALYALAKFKKPEDIKLIRNLLLDNCGQISNGSFDLMKNFPDRVYLEVFEKYYPYHFYSDISHSYSYYDGIDFIKCIAVYRNERTANILDSILKKPLTSFATDTVEIRKELISAIWNNDCKAYSTLRSKIKNEVNEYHRSEYTIDSLGSVYYNSDTTLFRWPR